MSYPQARWRLVETAWDLGITRNAIVVSYEEVSGSLSASTRHRRTTITSCRDALNGYQKGRCFYCFGPISILPGAADLGDVDHFFPHVLRRSLPDLSLNGVWNLVLACVDCNRGSQGKSARVPTKHFLDLLYSRNEYLIASHHPLRETLMNQTGAHHLQRQQFLQRVFDAAVEELVHTWSPASAVRGAF